MGKQERFEQQWDRILDKRPSTAVERRAKAVVREYHSLARDCDEGRFVEAESGLQGPFARTFRFYLVHSLTHPCSDCAPL